MTSYTELFLTILPVFAIIAIGVLLRHSNWITEGAESSLLNLVVKVTYPCLVFESVARNTSFSQAGNLLLPPVLGFVLTMLAMAVSWYVARALGLTIGNGLRTFAMAVGLTNYGYLPLPILEKMFGPESRGVLLVHNVGVEAALWTGGILVVTGLSPVAGWRKIINAPVISLVVALAANLTGVAARVPDVVMNLVHALAVVAIPLGLIMTGVSIQPHMDDPKQLINRRVTLTAWLLRLVVLPWIILLAARYVPCPVELKRVLVVQAAMPSAVFSIIIARVFGGQPLVAVQIILGTTALALFTIPFWIRFGLTFTGLAP